MAHGWFTDQFLYCCLSPEQKTQLQADLDNRNYRTAYLLQENLVKEKTGYRCRVCGAFYPFLQIQFKDQLTDPKSIAKIPGKTKKFKKATTVFCGDHYYAINKKSLLKFEVNPGGNAQQTGEIPVMGGVCQTILSGDEKYMATVTLGHTVAIIDVSAKQTIAKKRKCSLHCAAFTQNNHLLYFFQDAIRCWNFIEDREEIIWQVPGEWKVSPYPVHVVCSNIVHNPKENTFWFQCAAGEATYAVVIKNMSVEKVLQLPKTPTLSKLVYAPNQNVYTLSSNERIFILDESGQNIETLPCPQRLVISDGGGCFPITRHPPESPRRAFLSPDGGWILLDYFTSVILWNRKDHKIQYCLYSYTGTVAQHMGFTDSKHFWYTWGDTTYVQEIPETW